MIDLRLFLYEFMCRAEGLWRWDSLNSVFAYDPGSTG